MASLRSSLIVAIGAVLTLSLCAKAESRPGDFLVSKWTTDQGLPQNTVTSIVQTSDGYIWLGTFGGLARFDGIRFTVFDAANTPGFKANRVLSLHSNPKGGLWVGTESGEVYTIKGNRLEEFRSGLDLDKKAVWGIEEDALGNLFISSVAGIESFKLDENGWPVRDSGKIVMSGDSYKLYKDRNGRVWADRSQDLVLLSDSSFTSISTFGYSLPSGVHDLTFDETGRAFVAGWDTLGEISRTGYRELIQLDPEDHRSGSAIGWAKGKIWYQEVNELYEIADGKIVLHDLRDYVQQGSRAIFGDREGNVWLATQADGLLRLTRKKIGSMAALMGHELNRVYSVVQDGRGTIWFTGSELTGMNGNTFETIKTVSDGRAFPTLTALAVDPDDRLWAGSLKGLYRAEGDRLIPIPEFADRHVQSLFFDRAGKLWVGTETGIVIRGEGELKYLDKNSGLPSDNVHFITQVRDGTIWIGTLSGIAKADGKSLKVIPGDDRFAGDYVRAIHEADDGEIWVGTYGSGLKRLKDGKVSTIVRSNGLPNNFISRILVTADGKFWILSNFGVFAVAKEDLDRVADGRAKLLGGAVFGVADGMTSSEANGGHQPAGTVTSDGRLWFPMIDDLVWIDPKNTTGIAPVVRFENALSRSSDQPERHLPLNFDPSRRIEINNGVRNLEIEYAGLSFTKPEATRYVYMLEGLDPDWIDAGNRRTAFFPYLPAGDYKFLVKAVSADGIWSKTASLRIHVAEKFWESRWFFALLFVSALALVALIFWNRLRIIEERQSRKAEFARQLISAGERERRRIATELHDGLSQNLLLIMNWAALAASNASGEEKLSVKYLEKIGAVAAESIDETRTIIENLGPQNLDRFGLTEAITNITEQVEDAFGIVFELDVENIDGTLDGDAELNIFRMVQECVNNVVKHSGSPRGIIRIRKEPSAVVVAVSDFGIGIQPNGSIGNGLSNLKERAELLGGNIDIEYGKDEGTTVTITLPYRK